LWCGAPKAVADTAIRAAAAIREGSRRAVRGVEVIEMGFVKKESA